MVARTGLFVAPASAVGTSPTDGRLVLGGLFGTGGGCVTGGALTASGTLMQVTVAAAVWRIPDPTNSAGVYLSPADPATLTFSAGPASGSRIDIIWVRQNNFEAGDADSRVTYGVTAGTAASSPVAPATPAGALKIGQLTVPTGVTNAAACTLTATYGGQSVLRPQPAVGTEAQLPSAGDYIGQLILVTQVTLGSTTLPVVERWSGSAWQRWDSDWAVYMPGMLGFATFSAGGFYRYHAGRVLYEFAVTSTGAGSTGNLLVGLPVLARSTALYSGGPTSQSGFWSTGRANIFNPGTSRDYDCAIAFNSQSNLKFGIVDTTSSGVLTVNQTTPAAPSNGYAIRGVIEYDPA